MELTIVCELRKTCFVHLPDGLLTSVVSMRSQDEKKYEETLKGALWKEHVARLSVTAQVNLVEAHMIGWTLAAQNHAEKDSSC
jgi:hypothetical protein